jgi:hypothetical protein
MDHLPLAVPVGGLAPDRPSVTTWAEVSVAPAFAGRNRRTTAFRVVLGIPHLILVGGPLALALSVFSHPEHGGAASVGAGALGAAAVVASLISWFAIVFTGRHPTGLWRLAAYYLRWRVRAAAYLALLRDEYPPFGDAPYPTTLTLIEPTRRRDRVTVFFRPILVLPHLVLLVVLGLAWILSTMVAWVSIVATGEFPVQLHHFGVGMLRWSTRVEAYMLLLSDEYPPFTFESGLIRS